MSRDLDLPQPIASLMEEVDICITGHISRLPKPVSIILTGPSTAGKRVRALLTLICGLISGKADPTLVTVAAACELLHLATLIHDDLIDDHQVRRGHPAVHTLVSPATTVLIADVILARSLSILIESQNGRIIESTAATLVRISETELRVHLGEAGRSFSRKEYMDRISDKTASLFATSAACGASLGGGDDDQCTRLARCGELIGITFQIRDDILDYSGGPRFLRQVGADLAAGQVTLPLILHQERAGMTPAFTSWIEGDRSSETIETLIAEVHHSGALVASGEENELYSRQAIEIAAEQPAGPVRDTLITLCRYAAERDW
ncbi:MAG TPA: polyprenyl synthetase family protein [Methanospirillum sp.]|nr:polyprenyl synthetase family protein [Methanospirillum sp.]